MSGFIFMSNGDLNVHVCASLKQITELITTFLKWKINDFNSLLAC